MELLGKSKVATSTVHFLYKDATATKICSNSAMKLTGLDLAVRRKFPNIKYAIIIYLRSTSFVFLPLQNVAFFASFRSPDMVT